MQEKFMQRAVQIARESLEIPGAPCRTALLSSRVATLSAKDSTELSQFMTRHRMAKSKPSAMHASDSARQILAAAIFTRQPSPVRCALR
jgi:hypothetical protein